MLFRVIRAIVVPIIIYGSLCVLSALRKRRTTPQKEKEPTAEVPEVIPVARPVFPFAGIHEVPIPGSELCYCKPFGPSDSMSDVWCKLQTFVSGDPIVVRVGTPASPPLFKSSFSPDGAVHSSGTMFTDEFASRVRRQQNWPSICRQVRALSSFGAPQNALEGSYRIYTGPLFIDLNGAQLNGAHYQIQAVFEPNLGLVAKHFAGSASYLSCPVESGDQSNIDEITVGFPLTLVRLTLTADAPSDIAATPEFVQDLKESYRKYVLCVPAANTGQSTETRTIISDGMVVISISEGLGEAANNRTSITYRPMPEGPLDALATSDQQFGHFVTSIGKRLRTPVSSELETSAQ